MGFINWMILLYMFFLLFSFHIKTHLFCSYVVKIHKGQCVIKQDILLLFQPDQEVLIWKLVKEQSVMVNARTGPDLHLKTHHVMSKSHVDSSYFCFILFANGFIS